jgi:hypothetical protein
MRRVKVGLYESSTLIASATKDAYLDPVDHLRLMYSRSGLDSAKTYKLVVETLGPKNASSTGTRVDVDSSIVIRL